MLLCADAVSAMAAHERARHRPKPTIPQGIHLEAPIADPSNPDNLPIVFYDIWVARDIAGNKFWWDHPFVSHRASGQAVVNGEQQWRLPCSGSCDSQHSLCGCWYWLC